MEQVADRDDAAAAVDKLFSLPSENISIEGCIQDNKRKQTEDCFVMRPRASVSQ